MQSLPARANVFRKIKSRVTVYYGVYGSDETNVEEELLDLSCITLGEHAKRAASRRAAGGRGRGSRSFSDKLAGERRARREGVGGAFISSTFCFANLRRIRSVRLPPLSTGISRKTHFLSIETKFYDRFSYY